MPTPTGSCSISKGTIVADGTAAEVKALASGRTIRATLFHADEASLREYREWTTSRSVAKRSTSIRATPTRWPDHS